MSERLAKLQRFWRYQAKGLPLHAKIALKRFGSAISPAGMIQRDCYLQL